MNIILQIGVVFGVCLAGEVISALLPFAFPASVIAMLLLLLLLAVRAVRAESLSQISGFFLNNMPIFFIPACVGILKYLDALLDNLLPIALICIGTTPLVFAIAGHTVQLAIRLMDKREEKKNV